MLFCQPRDNQASLPERWPQLCGQIRCREGVGSGSSRCKREEAVFESASAETSVTVRRMHPESFCQFGFGSYALQPLPAPLHTVSLLRVLFAFSVRVVPPTAVTYCEAAGYSTPKPLSPDENVIGL